MKTRLSLFILFFCSLTAGAVWVGLRLSSQTTLLSEVKASASSQKLNIDEHGQQNGVPEVGKTNPSPAKSPAKYGPVSSAMPRGTNTSNAIPLTSTRTYGRDNNRSSQATQDGTLIIDPTNRRTAGTPKNPRLAQSPITAIDSPTASDLAHEAQPPPSILTSASGQISYSNEPQRRTPITTAKPGIYTESDAPKGDEVIIISEATASEGIRSSPVPEGITDEERLVELGERMTTAPQDAKSDIEKRFAALRDEEERMQLLILANASGDEKLAQRMIAQGLLPKQPIAIRLQALEFAFSRDPTVAQRYKNDADPHMRFNAQSLLGLNPIPPDE